LSLNGKKPVRFRLSFQQKYRFIPVFGSIKDKSTRIKKNYFFRFDEIRLDTPSRYYVEPLRKPFEIWSAVLTTWRWNVKANWLARIKNTYASILTLQRGMDDYYLISKDNSSYNIYVLYVHTLCIELKSGFVECNS
jgi:hypothetical protein